MTSQVKDRKRHEALASLKPICIALMQNFSPSEASRLKCALKSVDKDITQEILQYLLFPLQNALHQKSLSESELIDVCSTLDAILQKACINSTTFFLDLFNPLIFNLSSPEHPSQVCAKSEEVKTALVKSISLLFESSNDSVLRDVYSLKFMPAIGQVVSLILSMAEFEKSRSLQIESLDCVLAAMQTETKYGSCNAVDLGDFFAFCLPGVTMATTRVITGDQKQGHGVIRKAMTTLAKIVHMTLADSLVEKSQKRLATKDQLSDTVDERLRSLKIQRNGEWVKASASKVKLLLEKICRCNSHSNWRVRATLVDVMGDLLQACSKSLKECVPKILDCLVALISDDYSNVANKASSTLKSFSVAQKGTEGERTLKEILEENLHSLVTSLPRRIRMSDEEEKPVVIKLLKGYIILLDSNIASMVNSSPHLTRLALALVHSLDMETSDVKVMEDRQTLLDYEADTFYSREPRHVWKPRRFFKHFRDEAVLAELLSVCQLLGKYGNVLTLVDHFLDLYRESSSYTLASVLIINEIVAGAATPEKGDNQGGPDPRPDNQALLPDVISMLLEEYTSQENRHLIDFSIKENAFAQSGNMLTSSLMVWKPDPLSQTHKTIAKRNKAILLICLFMEGLGKFADVLKEDFGEHLIQALYPLVENLGHENVHISSTAYLTLTQICSACGYSSVDHLMQANADYLLNSVSLRLRHFEQNQQTPRVLSVMLRYCSQDLLPLVDHSITEILDSLDNNYTEHLVLFMPVLQELTTAIGRWFPYDSKIVTPVQNVRRLTPKSKGIEPQAIVSFVEDFVKQRKILDGDFTDGEVPVDERVKERTLEDIGEDMKKVIEERKKQASVEEDEEEGEENEEEVKKCPRHVQVVKEILQRIKNLLSSRDARVRVQALEIVAQACKDLGKDEKDLLPEIHQLWPSFHPRFRSEEKFVIIKALLTLSVMADVSGSFIQQRILKDVIPGLAQFMEKQAKISYNSHSAYLHTNNYKLQLAILTLTGPIAEKIAADGNHLETIAAMCLPYLSDLQPINLQKACTEAFSHFINLDADAVWLLLCQTYCPVDLRSVSRDFYQLQGFNHSQEKDPFVKNITQIFETFY